HEEEQEYKKEDIINQFLPKIRSIAQKLSFNLPPELSTEDLVSAGIIGLMEAIERFDPEKNTKLKTFAEFRIRGAMIDEIRAMQWASRDIKRKMGEVRKAYEQMEMKLQRSPDDEEVAAHMGITLEELYDITKAARSTNLVAIEDIGANYSEGNLDFLECLSDPNAVDQLTLVDIQERKELLLEAIESLSKKEKMVITLYYYEELTMKEVGAILGLSESRVCQIHGQAISRLKKKVSTYR
ncbi:MAG: FliA/WhiG family RNA polymerase sigma factor, partial [Nitrospirae bacterium]